MEQLSRTSFFHPTLFQPSPLHCTGSYFKDKGFTTSICGYIRSAKQRQATLLWNNHRTLRRFQWFLTINLKDEQGAAQIRKEFNSLTKRFQQSGLTGHWTREVNEKNLVHYHILILNGCVGTKQRLRRVVKRCRDESGFSACRVYVDRVRSQRRAIAYALKAKIPGHDKDGKYRLDLHGKKRTLFAKKTGLKKCGTFGKNFWFQGWDGDPKKSWSETKIWDVIKADRKRIETNLKDRRVAQLVTHISDYFGIPLERVKWTIGLYPYSPRCLQWMKSLEPSARSQTARTSKKMRRPKSSRSTVPWLILSLFKRRTSSRMALKRPPRSKSCRGIPRPIRNDKDERWCLSGPWVPSSDLRLPLPRSP